MMEATDGGVSAGPEPTFFSAHLDAPLEEAIVVVSEALAREGFGVLTRIDLHEAFREKLGADFRPYTILGACNPMLAHAALETSPEIGLFLPCNVTVERADDGGSLVRFVDPRTVLGGSGDDVPAELAGLADDARGRIERVARSLSTETG